MVNKRFIPKQGWYTWFETGIILFIILSVCYAIHSSDPFYITGQFPWPLISLLLIAVRFGFLPGLLASVFLLLLLYIYISHISLQPFPLVYAFGLLLSTMIVGEFSDMWKRHVLMAEQAKIIIDERYEELKKSYQMLKLSHDRLDMELAGKELSIRQSLMSTLEQFRDVITDKQFKADKLYKSIMHRYSELTLIRQACIIDVASLNNDKMNENAVFFGDKFDNNNAASMIRLALSDKACISINMLSNDYLINNNIEIMTVIPFIQSNQEIKRLLIIKDMPFFSFHEDNLNLLMLLSGYLADVIDDVLMYSNIDIDENFFIRHLLRSLSDFENLNLPFSLVIIEWDNHVEHADFMNIISENNRNLDVTYKEILNDKGLILVLMPLTSQTDVATYVKRITTSLVQIDMHNYRINYTGSSNRNKLISFLTKELGDDHFICHNIC